MQLQFTKKKPHKMVIKNAMPTHLYWFFTKLNDKDLLKVLTLELFPFSCCPFCEQINFTTALYSSDRQTQIIDYNGWLVKALLSLFAFIQYRALVTVKD